MHRFKSLELTSILPWLLIACGAIGLAASFIITIEKIELLENPAYSVSCDIDPIVSCGSVMSSNQASAFGFLNTIIGLAAFPVLITTGVFMLTGAKMKRWYALGLNFGALLGTIFVHWLFYQSVWDIQALCPWCMSVWIATITTFWYVTLYNLQQGFIRLPGGLERIAAFVRRRHIDILIFWFLAIAGLILHHFWYYYGEKLGF